MTLFVVAAGVVAVALLLAVDAALSRRREQEWEQVRDEVADFVRQGKALLDQVARLLAQSQPGNEKGIYPPPFIEND